MATGRTRGKASLDTADSYSDIVHMTAREKSWLAGLAILSVLALVELFYIPGHSQLLQETNNVGHIPVFGILAVAMLHLVKLAAPSPWKQLPRAYGVAFVLAAVLGAGSELVQYFTPRDASFDDLVRDLVGAASFLALYAALRDPDLRQVRKTSNSLRNKLLLVTASLWLLGGWSFLLSATAWANRNISFPVICDFDSWLSTRSLDPIRASLELGVESDASGIPASGTRVHFEGKDWPGVRVTDVYPDWSHYDSLVLEVAVEGNQPLFLGLAVADQEHNQEYDDRFSTGFEVDPGQHRLAVSLAMVHRGPVHRTLDMSRLDDVRIFTDSSGAGQTVLLERLLLK